MKKGFTLIEVLVVVLIIGILAAVALPQYTLAVEKSRLTEAMTNLKYAQQARIMDYLNSNAPSSPKDIIELGGGFWNAEGTAYCTKNFRYTFDDYTCMDAWRCKPNNDCTACQTPEEYDIYKSTPFDGEGWENRNSCEGYTDMGYKICKSLEGQGFTPYDAR
jgi:prepilin-type N-terminal cleavage/methylation domain-containing protein